MVFCVSYSHYHINEMDTHADVYGELLGTVAVGGTEGSARAYGLYADMATNRKLSHIYLNTTSGACDRC